MLNVELCPSVSTNLNKTLLRRKFKMKSIIERAMEKQLDFAVEVDENNFLNMSEEDREFLLSVMTEKEQFENLKNFRTLPTGLIEWNQKGKDNE